ncbi:hypothetical protein HBI55_057340 [Parastagonospora nodorum]|nr:hypothetical protein HBH75_084980 [Parastagonospora nodorum]KAH6500397.1 hypothetical protein HBI55_057340 [Parastagonospora nodorum]
MALHKTLKTFSARFQSLIIPKAHTMDSQRPFPFQKLPIEIRLMVYECLPVQIKRHDFNTSTNTPASSKGRSFTTVSKYLDLSILQTCRQVHAEASAIMRKKVLDILETPPRWIIDLSQGVSIHKSGGPLWHISRYLARRAVKARKALGGVPYLGTGMGAGGARYNPESDPDYAKLARMTELWFRSLDHQRATTDSVPSIEVAIRAPKECIPGATVGTLRQLAKALFEEHGGFRFVLRRVAEDYPICPESMSARETKAIEFGHSRGDAVRAVFGSGIEAAEFEEQWSNGSYY